MIITPFDLQSHRESLWQTLAIESDVAECRIILDELSRIDRFWAFPGPEVIHKLYLYLDSNAMPLFTQLVANVVSSLTDGSYRRRSFIPFGTNLNVLDKPILHESKLPLPSSPDNASKKPYFEVLVVHPMMAYESVYRQALSEFMTDRDEFMYDLVFVDTAEDAVAAVLANPMIQACVLVWGFGGASVNAHPMAGEYLSFLNHSDARARLAADPLMALNDYIRQLRPELEQIFISELPLYELGVEFRDSFHRVLFHIEPFPDLHYYLLSGVRDRFSTPFFHALQTYSHKPRGVFHALPLSRASSIQDSPWIHDMLTFYGPSIFFAETSSTQGGLDSLLDPKGAIKQSHDKAAIAFGAAKTFFVTNGTSTANKIVMQTTLQPGDIVLISSDCHKSVPYAVTLSGAFPIFLETYSLNQYDLYGAVRLSRIKEILLDLKAHGLLDRVRQITLTNSTFDGLVYNAEQFMTEILEIKPDIIFHWDEAWFAFGHFNPLYHGRTAMTAIRNLKVKYAGSETVKLRVYVTQSTHKTLTAFRQGSMIHIDDALFNSDLFLEAYRMHTSTSPNYQLIASLDIGRRQVALEGFERTKQTLALAMNLRKKIQESDLLTPYFKVLDNADLVPESVPNKVPESIGGYARYHSEWKDAELVVDPTRLTMDIRNTGMTGSNFRELLINRYDIQVNKISHYTVLFIVNIGSTEASVEYLIHVLGEIAARLNLETKKRVHALDTPEIRLPQTREFHSKFRPFTVDTCESVDLRAAYFLAYNNDAIEFVPLQTQLLDDIKEGRELISASFVTPYPPGFPILAPGQRITYDILKYIQQLKIKEIHGYVPHKGLKVFKSSYLEQQ
jgi:arginine decarboxylase